MNIVSFPNLFQRFQDKYHMQFLNLEIDDKKKLLIVEQTVKRRKRYKND